MDKRAKKILFQAYWSSKGWKENYPDITKENLNYAIEKGLMFPPLSMEHNQLIEKTIQLRNKLKYKDIIKAFVASLSTRKLEMRSALLSYHFSADLILHDFQPKECKYGLSDMSYQCHHCHALKSIENKDLNVLNFERIKWGGVRHHQVSYHWFDLREFSTIHVPEPSTTDISILRNILRLSESSSLTKLKQELPNLLPSNHHERQALISLLKDINIIGKQRQKTIKQLFGPFL